MCFALKINQREKRKENKRKTNLKKAQRSKNNSSESRTGQEFKNQGEFKTQEESLEF